jgi:hypothetical protein
MEVIVTDDQSRRGVFLKAAAAAAIAATVANPAQGQTPGGVAPPSTPPTKDRRESKGVIDTVNQNLKKIDDQASARTSGPLQTSATPIRDSALWKQLQDRAQSYASLSNASLGTSFVFAAKDEDLLFRMQNVEVLINQAADLLERGLATRTDWNQLNAAAFNIKLELDQYFKLDEIHQEETAAGYYDHTPRETQLQAAADALAEMTIAGQSQALQKLDTDFYNDAIKNTISVYSMLLAYLSHMPDSQAAQKTFSPVSYLSPTSGVPETTDRLASDAAGWSSTTNVNLQQSWLWAQLSAIMGNRSVAQQRAKGSSVRSAWEAKNAGFRLRRTEVGRGLAEAKLNAYTQAGGALNYLEQMARLESSFNRDFRDALGRVRKAQEGISKLYGFSQALPTSVTDLLGGKTANASAYDDCLTWIRDAISYLTRFAQTDQRYSFSVSVKSRLGEDAFKTGKEVRDWATWTVKIDKALFPDQYYVRLRGISLYTVLSDRSAGVWTSNILPPLTSYCEQFGGAAGSAPVRIELDQKNARPAMAGRVSVREDVRTPDVIGAATFYNLSPFGDWRIKMYNTSSQGVNVRKVDDIVLELHLAMRMAV